MSAIFGCAADENALTVADGVIIPVQTQRFAVSGLQSLTDIIGQIKSTVNPKPEIMGILPTMVDGTNMSRDTLKLLTERYGDKVTNTHISRSVEAAYSAQKCKSLCMENNSKLGEEYKALAEEIMGR